MCTTHPSEGRIVAARWLDYIVLIEKVAHFHTRIYIARIMVTFRIIVGCSYSWTVIAVICALVAAFYAGPMGCLSLNRYTNHIIITTVILNSSSSSRSIAFSSRSIAFISNVMGVIFGCHIIIAVDACHHVAHSI